MSVEQGFIGITLSSDFGEDGKAFFRAFPTAAARSASRAINRTMNRKVLPLGVAAINEQVDFPDGYVKDRLTVRKFSTPTDLEGQVAGRDRATSLRRFLIGTASTGYRGKNAAPLTVQVKPGQTRTIPGYLVNLKSGNVGFAIRLRPGDTLRGSRSAVELPPRKGDRPDSGTTYLLYGPSIDQIFVDVTDQITPQIDQALALEFFRLMDVEFGTGGINDEPD